MDKFEYLLQAIRGEAYKSKAWILSVFTVILEKENAWSENPFLYRLVRDKYTMKAIIPKDSSWDFVAITGGVVDQPLFTPREKIVLEKGDLVNVFEKTETTVGNVLVNAIISIYPFGDKFPFMTGKIDGKAFERRIGEILEDNPKPGVKRDPKKVYVDEFLKYCEAEASLSGLSMICVPTATHKSLTVDPKILKRRDELLKEYKDQLKDPAIIAKIEAELIAMDIASFKGDIAEGFLIDKSKDFGVARKATYIMQGMETGFGDPDKVKNIPTSLAEGMNINDLPIIADAIRAGSYKRGKETELGGEQVKYFYRVYQNTRVAEEDCGVRHGLNWEITKGNYKQFVGMTLASDPKAEPISMEFLKDSIGKTLEIRSPMLCKTKAPSFCAKCVGEALARNPNGLLIAASDIGSRMMGFSMSAMHAVQLVTEPYDMDLLLS